MMNARVKGCRLVVRFVCELSWVWYGGARVVEVFGVRVGECRFRVYFYVFEGGGLQVFAKVIVVGDFSDLLRNLGMTC